MNLVKTVGLNTRYYRFKRGLTEGDFANSLHIDLERLQRIESGREKLGMEDLQKIVKVLAIEPSDLYNFEIAAQMDSYDLEYFY